MSNTSNNVSLGRGGSAAADTITTSVAIGYTEPPSDRIALGRGAIAHGARSIAIGTNANAVGPWDIQISTRDTPSDTEIYIGDIDIRCNLELNS